MAPELLESMDGDELRELAAKVREWQLSHPSDGKPLSDAALCKRFPDLGSTKTLVKIRTGDWDELSLENQLDNYRMAWANIEALGGAAESKETLYDGVWATLKLATAFARTSKVTTPARCIFLLGPSGAGKTSAVRHLANKRGSRMFCVQANTVWNDAPAHMLGAILDELGVRDVPQSPIERLGTVQKKLKQSRRCLVIEDAHHLGPRLLSLVITLIDTTPGEVILPAIDKLWSKIETKAFAVCRQLTGNRLAEKIEIGDRVRASDASKLLADRVQWTPTDDHEAALKRAAEYVSDKANGAGLLSFVRGAISRLNIRLAESGGKTATWEDLVKATDEELRNRGGGK